MAPSNKERTRPTRKPDKAAGEARPEATPAGVANTAEKDKLEAREERWVVLIYMAVTSPQLREIMERDLAELETRLNLLGPEDLRVYALMDTPDGKYGVRHRLHETDGTTKEPALAMMRPDPGVEERIGTKGAFLAELIDWRFSPARAGEFETEVATFGKTLLILWGHSQGVATALSMPGSPAYSMIGTGGFGFNEFTGDSLSLPQIRRAIAAGLASHQDNRIDVLSFDSCFMSAAEVSAEFQPSAPPFASTAAAQAAPAAQAAKRTAHALGDLPARVDYVVASQSAVLLDGLDYGRLVDVFINALPRSVSPDELGRGLLEQASSTTNSPVSLSLLYTGAAAKVGEKTPYWQFDQALRNLVRQLAEVLDTDVVAPTPSTPPERPRRTLSPTVLHAKDGFTVPAANRSEWLRIRDAFETATWHRVRQFIDVADLCRRLANNCRKKDLRDAALGVLKSLQRPVECDRSQSLVVDVRSLPPLLLSGMSLYCPWVFPTPEEVRNGAWNAVVDLYDYATSLWFNRGDGSWGAFVYNAKHVLEESRQRAINTELSDLRNRTMARAPGAPPAEPSAQPDATTRSKEGRDKFQSAEPAQMPIGPSSGPPPSAGGRSQSALAAAAATQGPLDRVSICPKRR